MLRLSNRGRYAVRAVFDLAFHTAGDAREPAAQVREVADRQHIPLRFLEQILQELKRAGLVESKRGPRGGFRLARSPDDVRLGDVLRAVDGPLAVAPPARRRSAGQGHDADLRDVADGFLADVGRSVERCFDDVTLRDLCARGDELGLRTTEGTSNPANPANPANPGRWVI